VAAEKILLPLTPTVARRTLPGMGWGVPSVHAVVPCRVICDWRSWPTGGRGCRGSQDQAASERPRRPRTAPRAAHKDVRGARRSRRALTLVLVPRRLLRLTGCSVPSWAQPSMMGSSAGIPAASGERAWTGRPNDRCWRSARSPVWPMRSARDMGRWSFLRYMAVSGGANWLPCGVVTSTWTRARWGLNDLW